MDAEPQAPAGIVNDTRLNARELTGLFLLFASGLIVATSYASHLLVSHITLPRFVTAIDRVAPAFAIAIAPVALALVIEELVRRRRHEVELQNRLEVERELAASMDEFIADASHELRTPLTGITGMAMLLEEDPILQESDLAHELVRVIIGESHDLERMVEDLLTTTRLDAGALQITYSDVRIQEEVEDVAGALVRSGLDIAVDCRPASVWADRLRLRQIVRNLLSNAKKYGGPHIRVDGRIEGHTYRISVSDNGPGLGAAIANDAFERFVHRGKGTATTESVGLGLSIVRSLSESMGGSVSYLREGGWTTFEIRLRLLLTPADPARGDSRAVPPLPDPNAEPNGIGLPPISSTPISLPRPLTPGALALASMPSPSTEPYHIAE